MGVAGVSGNPKDMLREAVPFLSPAPLLLPSLCPRSEMSPPFSITSSLRLLESPYHQI